MAASLKLPCLSCASPQADDVKHALGQGALEEACNKTPGGLPIMCCRIRLAGWMPTTDQLASNGRRF
jgi:hypothetical protein